VFENRVLRKIFRPKTEKVTGGWRELHNEELNDLYFSQNVIHYQIKKIEMGGAYFSQNVIHYQIKKIEMGGACNTYGREEVNTGFLWGNLRETDHLGDLRVDGRITLE